jgi:hypothetical protein
MHVGFRSHCGVCLFVRKQAEQIALCVEYASFIQDVL